MRLYMLPAASLASAVVLAYAAMPALAQGAGDPAQNWTRIAACAPIERADERQACVDEVFRAAGLREAARTLAQQRESFGEQPRPRSQPAPQRSAAAEAPRAAPAAPAPELDSITTTVSRAFDPGNRLMVIVTQDGQVWQQSESRDLGLPPRPGTAFMVEKGSLGSFICRIGNGRSFRCRRQG